MGSCSLGDPVKRALVTGSSGFLGRHFCAALEASSWVVRRIDLADQMDPRNALDFFRQGTGWYDLAIHCAAVVGGRRVIEQEPLRQAVNLALDAEFFGWAQRTRPGRLVYLSSSAVYPIELQNEFAQQYGWRLPEWIIDLDYLRNPDAFYGWQKLTGEILAKHAREAGLNVTVVRPFSGYGADQDLAYPFPAFLERARQHENPFLIWGDGEQVRDFIHVDDLVAGTLAAVEAEVDGPLNLCSGMATSFNQLAELVCSAAGYSPRFQHQPEAPRGVSYRVGEPSEMLKVYQPQISLAEGVQRALALPTQRSA